MPKNINHKERITLDDSMMNIVMKMADGNPGAVTGNPGAVTVLFQLIADKNDPDSWAGGLGNLLSLDTLGIYGPDIWVLFKDVCGQNILNVVTVLRAVQLGLYSERNLWNCIDNRTSLDCEQLLTKVRERLPRFGNVDAQLA